MRKIRHVVEGRLIGEELGCRSVETSAKLDLNVTETVFNLVRQIRDQNKVCVCELFPNILRLGPLFAPGSTHISRNCSVSAAYRGLWPPPHRTNYPGQAVGTVVAALCPD